MTNKERNKIVGDLMDDDNPTMCMWKAAASLKLLAKYGMEFTDDIDREDMSCLCGIISEYLYSHADKICPD